MSDDNKKNGSFAYAPIFKTIQDIDKRVKNMKVKLDEIKATFVEPFPDDTDAEEVCVDEIEADKVALEIIKDFYIEQLASEDPEGEA